MKFKTKIKLRSYLPQFLAERIEVVANLPLPADRSIAKVTVRTESGRIDNGYSYIAVDCYSCYYRDKHQFSDVLIYRESQYGRMVAITNGQHIVFIRPYASVIGFVACSWAEITVSLIANIVWIPLDEGDRTLLKLGTQDFSRFDFEDYILQNENLTETNLGFLFVKYA